MLHDFFKAIKIKLNNGINFVLLTNHPFGDEVVKIKNEIVLTSCDFKGCSLSSIVDNSSFGVNNSTLSILLTEKGIFSLINFENELFKKAKFEIYRIDRSSKTEGFYDLNTQKMELTGYLGNVTNLTNVEVEIELRSFKADLEKTMIKTIKKYCNHTFCDENCGLNVENYSYNLKILNIISQNSIIVQVVDEKNLFENINNFNVSFLTFARFDILTGKFKNFSLDIRKGEVVNVEDKTLKLYFNSNISLNLKSEEKIKLILQCNKTRESCISTFNNLSNFSGFSYLPTKSNVVASGKANLYEY